MEAYRPLEDYRTIWCMVRSTVPLETSHLYLPVRYPIFIDAVFQSQGIGFVGTQRSTVSTLARKRVSSFHDGVSRLVEWGKMGADDH
ncbi:hypothetical protein C8J57DRAFT_1299363 [Mycena rebaudengoi]|nr:hypothetical protein C8J57DRAFT_1299363 [Mycena rebaudengoi]